MKKGKTGMDKGAMEAEGMQAWLGRLERAADRLGRIEGRTEPMVLAGARAEDWPLIVQAFREHRVPLTPELRALYTSTMGINNPHRSIPVLVPPVLQGEGIDEDEFWSIMDIPGLMETNHQWPIEDIEEGVEGVVPFATLMQGGFAGLSIGPNGRFTTQTFTEGDEGPRLEVFTQGFEDAFAACAQHILIDWANAHAGDVVGWRAMALRPALADLPVAVQEAYAWLVSPMEEEVVRGRLRASWVSWADGGALGGQEEEEDEVDQEGREEGSCGPVSVVGLGFGEYHLVADAVGVGTLLRPRPVEDNPHDPKAVEVWLDQGEQGFRIGFVARDAAVRVRGVLAGAPGTRLRVSAIRAGWMEAELVAGA